MSASRPAIALIANPKSGSGEGARVGGLLRSHGAELLEFDLGDEEKAAASEADRVVIAGGDGSIAPAALAAGKAGKPLAVIPVGTANDFARATDLPSDVEEASELAATGERTRALDVGHIGDRPFVNVASAGLPPVAAREAEGMKKALGPLAYAVGAVRAGLSASPLECSVSCDEETLHDGGAWQVTVACSGAFGGGSSVEADPRDGKLDVVVIPAGSRFALAWRAYGLRSGRIDRQREVEAHRCSHATLHAPASTVLNVDGDLAKLGEGKFTITQHAFELVVG